MVAQLYRHNSLGSRLLGAAVYGSIHRDDQLLPSECDDVIRSVGTSAEAEGSRAAGQQGYRAERSLIGWVAPSPPFYTSPPFERGCREPPRERGGGRRTSESPLPRSRADSRLLRRISIDEAGEVSSVSSRADSRQEGFPSPTVPTAVAASIMRGCCPPRADTGITIEIVSENVAVVEPFLVQRRAKRAVPLQRNVHRILLRQCKEGFLRQLPRRPAVDCAAQHRAPENARFAAALWAPVVAAERPVAREFAVHFVVHHCKPRPVWVDAHALDPLEVGKGGRVVPSAGSGLSRPAAVWAGLRKQCPAST